MQNELSHLEEYQMIEIYSVVTIKIKYQKLNKQKQHQS